MRLQARWRQPELKGEGQQALTVCSLGRVLWPGNAAPHDEKEGGSRSPPFSSGRQDWPEESEKLSRWLAFSNRAVEPGAKRKPGLDEVNHQR